MKRYIPVALAATLALAVAAPTASAATEHFLNNEAVSNGSSRSSGAHGAGNNHYDVYAHGLASDSYVCVRMDGTGYICSGIQLSQLYTLSGVLKGWAMNSTGRTINMNAHLTYGE